VKDKKNDNENNTKTLYAGEARPMKPAEAGVKVAGSA